MKWCLRSICQKWLFFLSKERTAKGTRIGWIMEQKLNLSFIIEMYEILRWKVDAKYIKGMINNPDIHQAGSWVSDLTYCSDTHTPFEYSIVPWLIRDGDAKCEIICYSSYINLVARSEVREETEELPRYPKGVRVSEQCIWDSRHLSRPLVSACQNLIRIIEVLWTNIPHQWSSSCTSCGRSRKRGRRKKVIRPNVNVARFAKVAFLSDSVTEIPPEARMRWERENV